MCCIYLAQIANGKGLFIGSSLALHKKINKFKQSTLPIKSTKSNKAIKTNSIDAVDLKDVTQKQQFRKTIMSLAMSLGSMVLSRKISNLNYKSNDVVMLARLGFCLYLVLTQVLYWLVVQHIKGTNDRSLMPTPSLAENPMAALSELLGSINNLADGGLATKTKKRALTVAEYDLEEARKVFVSPLGMEIGIVAFIHIVLRKNTPLLLAPLMMLSGKLQSPVSLLHLLRMQPVGDLQRPFKNMLETFVSSLTAAPATTAEEVASPFSPDAQQMKSSQDAARALEDMLQDAMRGFDPASLTAAGSALRETEEAVADAADSEAADEGEGEEAVAEDSEEDAEEEEETDAEEEVEEVEEGERDSDSEEQEEGEGVPDSEEQREEEEADLSEEAEMDLDEEEIAAEE